MAFNFSKKISSVFLIKNHSIMPIFGLSSRHYSKKHKKTFFLLLYKWRTEGGIIDKRGIRQCGEKGNQ